MLLQPDPANACDPNVERADAERSLRGLGLGLSISLAGHLLGVLLWPWPAKILKPDAVTEREYKVFLIAAPITPKHEPARGTSATESEIEADEASLPENPPPEIADKQDGVTPEISAIPENQRDSPRISILQSAEDFVRGQELYPDFHAPPSADTEGDPGNIFHPVLRQQMQSRSRHTMGGAANSQVLNTSALADPQERVAADGKCFRLEDFGGGGERRAWYRVKCRGEESTSDTMHRALLENLQR